MIFNLGDPVSFRDFSSTEYYIGYIVNYYVEDNIVKYEVDYEMYNEIWTITVSEDKLKKID